MNRHGLSLIELIVVMAVMAMLATLTVPGVLATQQRLRVRSAADDLVRLHRTVRLLAVRSLLHPDGAHYGIALHTPAGQKAYATVLFGLSATDEYQVDGEPYLRVSLPEQLEIWMATTDTAAPSGGGQRQVSDAAITVLPDDTVVSWFYRFGSGEPIATPGASTPTDIGVPGIDHRNEATINGIIRRELIPMKSSTIATRLEIRPSGGRTRMAVALYRLGMGNVLDLTP